MAFSHLPGTLSPRVAFPRAEGRTIRPFIWVVAAYLTTCRLFPWKSPLLPASLLALTRVSKLPACPLAGGIKSWHGTPFSPILSRFFTILFAGLLCITGYKICLEPSAPSVGQVSSEGSLKWCKRRFWHAPRKRKVKLLKDLKESPKGTNLNGAGWKVFRFKAAHD